MKNSFRSVSFDTNSCLTCWLQLSLSFWIWYSSCKCRLRFLVFYTGRTLHQASTTRDLVGRDVKRPDPNNRPNRWSSLPTSAEPVKDAYPMHILRIYWRCRHYNDLKNGVTILESNATLPLRTLQTLPTSKQNFSHWTSTVWIWKSNCWAVPVVLLWMAICQNKWKPSFIFFINWTYEGWLIIGVIPVKIQSGNINAATRNVKRPFGRQEKRGLRIIVITTESCIRVSARNQPFEWVSIPCQVGATCVLWHIWSTTQANKMNLGILA